MQPGLTMYRRWAANYPGSEHSANLGSGATSGHSLAAVCLGEPRTWIANSLVGEHQGV